MSAKKLLISSVVLCAYIGTAQAVTVEQATAQGTSIVTATASCPSLNQVVGSGSAVSASVTQPWTLTYSGPDDPSNPVAWRVQYRCGSTQQTCASNPVTVTEIAMCNALGL